MKKIMFNTKKKKVEFEELVEKTKSSLKDIDFSFQSEDYVKKYYTSLLLHYITTNFGAIKNRIWAINKINNGNLSFIDVKLINDYKAKDNLADNTLNNALYKYINLLDLNNWNYIADNKQFKRKVARFNYFVRGNDKWHQTFSRTKLVWFFLVLFLLFSISSLKFFDFGFMKHSNDEFYISKDDETNKGKGFIGKTNAIFNRIINEELNDVTFNSLDELVNGSNRISEYFTFYIPPNGLARDIRLIGVNSLTKEEEDFFYRSDFSSFIKKQNLNKDIPYFDISFKINENTNALSLNHININKELARIPLTNNTIWNGNIYGKLNQKLNNAIVFSDATGTYPIIPSNNLNQFGGNQLPLNINLLKHSQENFFDILEGRHSYSYKLFINNLKDSVKINLANFDNKIILQSTHPNLYNLDQVSKKSLIASDTLSFDSNRTYRFSASNNNYFQLTNENRFNLLRFIKTEANGNKKSIINKNYTSAFEQQISGVLPTIESLKDEEEVKLSFDNLLSSYLEKEIIDYVNQISRSLNNENVIVKMGITVINPITGEVLAAPSYNSLHNFRDELNDNPLFFRNSNLDNYHVGSAFKPLLLLNNFMLFPELSNFQLYYNTNFTSPNNHFLKNYRGSLNFLGYPISKRIYGADGSNSIITLNEALINSSNAYPFATTLLAMSCTRSDCSSSIYDNLVEGNSNYRELNLYENNKTHTDNINIIGNNTYVENFRNNKVIKMLDTLYSISSNNVALLNNELRFKSAYNKKIWGELSIKDTLYSFNTISPAKVSTRADLIDENQAIRGNLYSTFIVGAGNNRWNNIKLAEAYSRFFTKRKVKATFLEKNKNNSLQPLIPFVKEFNENEYNNEYTIDSLNTAWNRLFTGLEASFNRYNGFRRKLNQINNELGFNIVGMGKTGTPQNIRTINEDIVNQFGSDRIRTNGLLAMTLMSEDQRTIINQNTPEFINNNSGIVIVLNVLMDIPKTYYEENKETLTTDSGLAKRFYTEERLKNIILLTSEYFNYD